MIGKFSSVYMELQGSIEVPQSSTKCRRNKSSLSLTHTHKWKHAYWLYYHFCLFYILKFQEILICIKNSRDIFNIFFFNSTGKKKKKTLENDYRNIYIILITSLSCLFWNKCNMWWFGLNSRQIPGIPFGLLSILQAKIYSPEIFFTLSCSYSTSLSWCSRTDFVKWQHLAQLTVDNFTTFKSILGPWEGVAWL